MLESVFETETELSKQTFWIFFLLLRKSLLENPENCNSKLLGLNVVVWLVFAFAFSVLMLDWVEKLW